MQPEHSPNINPSVPQQPPANQPPVPVAPKGLEDNKVEEKKKSLNIKPKIEKAFKVFHRYHVPIIAFTVSGLLVITAIRMMHYASPVADDARIQENLKSFKQIRIDQKVVRQIKDLKTSNSKPGADIENGRTNPFSE
jgi:hypothetical protein